MAEYTTIELERQGSVGIITLNRPERLNALNPQLLGEVNVGLDKLEADEAIRVIVLTGAGRAFSAGFDLVDEAEAKLSGVGDWQPMLRGGFDSIMRFWHCPKPTISAVHGFAIAGGCELALACDVTIAAEGAMFGEPELRFGAGIVVLLLPWLTGPKQAKELLFTGNDRVPAQRALELGLINAVAPEGEHLDAALAMAHEISVVDPTTLAMTKRAVNQTFEIMGMRESLSAALDIDVLIEAREAPERQEFMEIVRKEGLRAAVAWRERRYGS